MFSSWHLEEDPGKSWAESSRSERMREAEGTLERHNLIQGRALGPAKCLEDAEKITVDRNYRKGELWGPGRLPGR